jgi:hypothetical protein
MSTTITLADDEAMVLFELLSSERIEKEIPRLEAPERHALSALSGLLEKALAQPFSSDHTQLLEKARASLVERLGT